jgi:signal transduction histidine kinase
LPIRLRLTLAFALVMGVVLAATGLFLYLRFESELDSSLNNGLRSRADEVAALVGKDASGLGETGGSPVGEADESFAQVIGPEGQVIDATSARLRTQSALTTAQLAEGRRGPLLVDRGPLRGFEDPSRVLAKPVEQSGSTLVVVVGSSRDDREEALASLRTVLLTGGPAALLLASLAGYGLASAALRPVESMRRRAAEISRLDTGRRLPVPPARDELAQLGDTLNEMLARLQRSVERERGFVASASHELRTPLALLKGELELALREGRSVDELRAAVASAAEESDRLVQLAEDLLVLARADQGRLPVRAEPLAAKELLSNVARRFARRAADGGRELRVDAPDDLEVNADRLRIEQALGNMLDNALRYGEGTVTVSARPAGGRVELHVRDDGPGFAPELLGRAFERFTRGDRARTRGGTGLGLALVEAVARAHGGRAAAANGGGGGADVWIEFPRAADRSGDRRSAHPQLIPGGYRS